MHREQNFLSRSWKAYLSLIEESPRLAGRITCQEQNNGSQAARWRLFQGRRAGLRHRSKHHGRGRGVATLRDRCKDRRGEDARALRPARVHRRRRGIQSLHPDGNRFLTSIAKWPYDIWMLEGFDQMPRKTWLDRLLRSLDSTPSPGTW